MQVVNAQVYEGVQYIMATHSKPHTQTHQNSIQYTKRKIKDTPFEWCIKLHSISKKAHSYTLNIFSSGLKRNILKELGRYAVILKGNCLQP